MTGCLKQWAGVFAGSVLMCSAWAGEVSVDLAEKVEAGEVTVVNRSLDAFMAETPGEIYLTRSGGDGIAWLDGIVFEAGEVEFEIKGRDQGMSFVGLAFAGHEGQYESIYFRPFNFAKQDTKAGKSVQYISMPGNGWKYLRDKYPGVYEASITPTPSGADWFKVRLVIDDTHVEVFVAGSETPTLKVERIAKERGGDLGFWVGNQSDGWFRNLSITHAKE